ncbi:MAG: hypothetical protein OEZ04_09130 [Nitrospinota bacterium]|nr:hypothetical protein [Nitrospinota bacterium]
MYTENIKQFIETGNFSTVREFLNTADPVEVLMMPPVFLVIVITIGLMFHPKTTHMGQKLLVWIPALLWLGVTGVVLKNDSISNIGPFILGIVSFFIVIGYMVYSQLMASD